LYTHMEFGVVFDDSLPSIQKQFNAKGNSFELHWFELTISSHINSVYFIKIFKKKNWNINIYNQHTHNTLYIYIIKP
jgi:hypothetical protein